MKKSVLTSQAGVLIIFMMLASALNGAAVIWWIKNTGDETTLFVTENILPFSFAIMLALLGKMLSHRDPLTSNFLIGQASIAAMFFCIFTPPHTLRYSLDAQPVILERSLQVLSVAFAISGFWYLRNTFKHI